MGGCISPADAKKPKPKIQAQKDNYASLKNYSTIQKSIQKSMIQHTQREVQFYKNLISEEFIAQYQIIQVLKNVSKVQGPKLIRNRIDGSCKVFRVYRPDQINQQRLKAYCLILGFDLYKDQQQSFLVIDQFCSGPQIVNLSNLQFDLDSTMDNSKVQLAIYGVILQIYDIISTFHQKGVHLGNLNMFSFKKTSLFSDEVRLVDFNFNQKQLQIDTMGHAHQNSCEADWQFFGFLLLYFLSDKTPIFIPHKMQYIQFSSLPYSNIIFSLLKGKKVQRKKIEQLKPEQIKIKNENVALGYRFRKDVNKLIKMRKKRNKHKLSYYDIQSLSQFQKRKQESENQYVLSNVYSGFNKISEQYLHRIEVQRHINNIKQYISQLNGQCQEAFINYGKNGQNMKNLKGVFYLPDSAQKMQQLKECIHQIK